MKLLRRFWILFFFPSIYSNAQKEDVLSRIILIGDAGRIVNGKNAVVEKARSLFNINDGLTQVIYLGDNLYESGLPDESSKDFEEKKKILDAQVSLVQGTGAHAYFVPGNSDWKKGKEGGWQQLKNQQKYLESLQLPNVEMLPKNGCPGPVEVAINDKVVMVFMDSEWWLEQLEKPGIGSGCDCETQDEVITMLKEIASLNSDKLMIVAMHHPFYTHGPHGGYYTLRQHIFPLTDVVKGLYIPLPVIGSIYPITREWFGGPQDTKNPKYRALIEEVEGALKSHPNVIHVAGHDHGLQFLQKDSISYVVSGAGAQTTQLRKGKYSLFADKENGFAVLEIMQSGKVTINFYTVNSEGNSQPAFTANLKTIEPGKEKNVPIETIVASFPDSASAIGSGIFKASGFKKMMSGKNYRKEWGESVTAPVFDMGKEMGGLKIGIRGGGHQTKSLRFIDASGKEYVIRAIEKTVTDAALPPDLRGTFVKDLVQDGVSASYPYAALSVPIFAEAAGVHHANPKLIYVPDDPRLGKYRIDFTNKMTLFEEREPGGFKKTINTADLYEKLQDDNDNHVDQKEFLKARLLDMFIMDFDRHEDQWRWGVVDEGKGNRYVAIPRDRDQAFFINQGFLPWVASQPWVTPQVQGFRSKARNIKIYNFNARSLDRNHLNELTETDWKKGSEELNAAMTDEVIEKGLAKQPEALKKYSYNSIINKLKERRKYYPGEMLTYYRFISKIVNVAGSDKKELFDVNRESDGSVTVTLYKITKDGITSTKMYERKFDPAVTKELRLYGLGGDDKFNIHGDGNKIKIRIIGGKGEDNFENSSHGGRTIVYDLNTEQNKFTGNFAMKLSDKPAVNNYEKVYYKYNVWIPFLSFAFNRDDGLFLGTSLKHITHGFRKDPFSTSQQIAVNHSLATSSYNFRYDGEFIKAIGSMDLLLNADIKAPRAVTNFFGYGNETMSFIDTKPGKINYYRSRYTLGDLSILFRKGGKHAHFSFGPAYQYYRLDADDNIGRIILNPIESGIPITKVTQDKAYMGGEFSIGIDTRNSPAVPVRGIYWQTTLKALSGLNTNSKNLTQLNSNMSLYMSFSRNPKIVLATRFGGGINFTKNFEFFQAQYLGGTLNMRGFRKYRFAGKSMAYNNTDIRIKIADFRSYLFPGSLGILFFHDIGRVWVDNDTSDKWHTGYGGGVWVSPMRRLVLSVSIAKSDEETLPVIGLGFQF